MMMIKPSGGGGGGCDDDEDDDIGLGEFELDRTHCGLAKD